MNWYRRLKFAQAQWGYWITRDGRRIPVGSESGHYDALKNAGMDSYEDAFEQGWVRLITGVRPGNVQAWIKPTQQQINIILSCFEETHQNTVFVSTHWYNGAADVYFTLEKALTGRAKSPIRMVQQKPDYVGDGMSVRQQEQLPVNQPSPVPVGA